MWGRAIWPKHHITEIILPFFGQYNGIWWYSGFPVQITVIRHQSRKVYYNAWLKINASILLYLLSLWGNILQSYILSSLWVQVPFYTGLGKNHTSFFCYYSLSQSQARRLGTNNCCPFPVMREQARSPPPLQSLHVYQETQHIALWEHRQADSASYHAAKWTGINGARLITEAPQLP